MKKIVLSKVPSSLWVSRQIYLSHIHVILSSSQKITPSHKHSVDFFVSVETQCVGTWEAEINVKYMCSGEGKDGILNLQNGNECTMHKGILLS